MEPYNNRARPRYTPGSFSASQLSAPHNTTGFVGQSYSGNGPGTGSGGSNNSSPGNTVNRNNNHYHPSLSPNSSLGRLTPLSILSTTSGASSGTNSSSSASSTMSSSTAKRNQNQYSRSEGGLDDPAMIRANIKANLNELKTSISEMRGLNSGGERISPGILSPSASNNSFSRSMSAEKKASLSSIMNRNCFN